MREHLLRMFEMRIAIAVWMMVCIEVGRENALVEVLWEA